MESLYNRSIQIIKLGQSESGAYIACPNFPTYHFCWLRDGSFIAHAMDTVGEYESAKAFFRWVGRTIQRYGFKVDLIRLKFQAGLPIGKNDVLHTRFTLDGKETTVDGEWGNFQIDGYGTWLWALSEHVRFSGDSSILLELSEPIQITLNYLELVWQLPNFDCWEEHPEYLHTYSLAAVFAGINSINSVIYANQLPSSANVEDDLTKNIKGFILKYCVYDGQMVKHILPERAGKSPRPIFTSGVDSSLIGVTVPFNLFSSEHPIMRATIQAIEMDLFRPGGGVYRYKNDVYYGGGEWLLLTAWIGWYYAEIGNVDKAKKILSWMESQANEDGHLPEQVNDHNLSPTNYKPWVIKWGLVANPLLWSHAMYLILYNAINSKY